VFRLGFNLCVPIPAVARPYPLAGVDDNNETYFIAHYVLVDIEIVVIFVRRIVTYSVLYNLIYESEQHDCTLMYSRVQTRSWLEEYVRSRWC
jgi:hypothetical protein